MASADVATQLVECFEKASSAANKALDGGDGVLQAEESRACDILQSMKKIKISADLLLQTQVGKKLRKLTKHRSSKIASRAEDLLKIWKRAVELEESRKSGDGKSGNAKPSENSSKSPKQLGAHGSIERNDKGAVNTLTRSDSEKKLKGGDGGAINTLTRSDSEKKLKGVDGGSAPRGPAKAGADVKAQQHTKQAAYGDGGVGVPQKGKLGSDTIVNGGRPVAKQSPVVPKREDKFKSEEEPPRLKEDRTPHGNQNSGRAWKDAGPPRDKGEAGGGNAGRPLPAVGKIACCGDTTRDKMRSLFCDALVMVRSEAVTDPRLHRIDPARVSVLVEDTMFRKFGSKSKDLKDYKAKYRTIYFNLKDAKNPDLRRRVLFGEISPDELMLLTPEDMASDERKMANEEIRKKALFECERGLKGQGSTDQFKCGKCGKREATFFQMQTRSADEPMTTYVTCINCNHHWKFC